jgi:hypothetical protein
MSMRHLAPARWPIVPPGHGATGRGAAPRAPSPRSTPWNPALSSWPSSPRRSPRPPWRTPPWSTRPLAAPLADGDAPIPFVLTARGPAAPRVPQLEPTV